MSVLVYSDWSLSEKGKRDVARHRAKILDQITKNIKGIVSSTPIVTEDDKGRTIRVRIRGLKDYYFKFKDPEDESQQGIGQSSDPADPNKPGDVIVSWPKQGVAGGGGPGGGGEEEDEEEFDTEVSIGFIIKLMFEDLQLPYIELKKTKKVRSTGFVFDSIRKHGPYYTLHKKRSVRESFKRSIAYVEELISETGCSEEDAFLVLDYFHGDLSRALSFFKEHAAAGDLQEVLDKIRNEQKEETKADFFVEDDDARFKQYDIKYELVSDCVLFCMMDISGSMDDDKKYYSRALFFWLTEFLRNRYDNVEIVFINHTDTAWVTDEKSFFTRRESGGTRCATAIRLASELTETKFPVSDYNVYAMYISDGEDFDEKATVEEVTKFLAKQINLFCYCEIQPQENVSIAYSLSLLDTFTKEFSMQQIKNDPRMYFRKVQSSHFVACKAAQKNHISSILTSILTLS